MIDGARLTADTLHARDGDALFPDSRRFRRRCIIMNGGVGLKANRGGKRLLDLNVRFK